MKREINELGEFKLIELLTKNVKLKHETSLKGIGDDAAITDYKGKKTVITTDMLTEGIHFDLMYTPLKHLGYKAVVVNLSDVYAMNALPQQILVSIALSAKFTVDMVEELYHGIKLACDFYKVDLVGGDTTSSLTGLTINITAIGIADEEKITLRSGAKENDLICVSGNLGSAYLGLQLLEREKKIFISTGNEQPDFSGFEYLLERQLKPEARHDIIEKLAEAGIVPHSMIDISDGLSSEILHICKASATGCRIYANRIPVSSETKKAAEELGMESLTAALNGGEDYELLFTVGLDKLDIIKNLSDISIIGHITSVSEGCMLILHDDSAIEIKAMGWDGISQKE